MKRPSRRIEALDQRFLALLGYFHVIWASLDLLLCYGIGAVLKIEAEECHVLTAGMEFGRKITVLRNIIHRSTHPKRKELIGLLGKIQNESKRNVFAHSFVLYDEQTLTFIDRTRGGDYQVKLHRFTVDEFAEHVISFGEAVEGLTEILCPDYENYRRFALAAFSAETKPTKSPVPPSSKA